MGTLNRATKTPEELVEDRDAIGLLEPTGVERPEKRSTVTQFRFPPQEHKLSIGQQVKDPELRDDQGRILDGGTVAALDDNEGLIELKRGPKFEGNPPPRAVIPGGPFNTHQIRSVLRTFAQAVVDQGLESVEYEAGRDILLRRRPRIPGWSRALGFRRGI